MTNDVFKIKKVVRIQEKKKFSIGIISLKEQVNNL